MKHTPYPNLPDNDNLQSTAVLAETGNGTNKIHCSYSPPKKKKHEAELDRIFNTNKATLALGDFNAENKIWNNRLPTKKEKKLQQYAENRNCVIYAPNEPTIVPSNNDLPNIIDLMIVRNCNKNITSTALTDSSSDHNPVIITINNETWLETEKTPKTYINWRNFKKS